MTSRQPALATSVERILEECTARRNSAPPPAKPLAVRHGEDVARAQDERAEVFGGS